ncbi:MAG: hypothetical protein IT245_07805 [Bacteroidia bacterium]|nr:hypothetical protein [Bacteroidia bacterium]
MRFKAIILIFIFVFSGNGLSIDISKCCDELSGIALGFNYSEPHSNNKACCPAFKNIDPKKSCCENVVFNTVINQVPGLAKKYTSLKNIFQFTAPIKLFSTKIVDDNSNYFSDNYAFDGNYPIPILLKKRVLTI